MVTLFLAAMATAFVLAVVNIFDVPALAESGVALVAAAVAIALLDPPVPTGTALVLVPAAALGAAAIVTFVGRLAEPFAPPTVRQRLRPN